MTMFWVFVLAVSILLYVLLDGFDLGVGILYGVTRDEARRRTMMSAIAPIWDGNETWLVSTGVVLWGAFPIVYATLLSACYLPLLLMLAGLVLRGVAFEFRSNAKQIPALWDASFAGGSLLAAFMQGLMVGALVEGLPISNGQYIGGVWGWLSPFAVLCGVGLCVGYALLGACWLIKKCEGESAGRGLSPDSLSLGRTPCLPHRRVHLCAGVRLSGHGSVAGAAIPIRLPRDRRHCGAHNGRRRSSTSGPGAFPHGRRHFRGGLRHARNFVLAIHDPVHHQHRGSGGSALQLGLHVLGSGPFRVSAHARLHRD